MAMKVRVATREDLPAIVALGQAMRAESRVPFPEIDMAAVRYHLDLLGELYFVAVAETGGRIVGMITGQPAIYIFSKIRAAQHDIFYVRPKSRGSRAALLLVRAFETWARETGAARATIAIHTGLRTDRTGRFYEKLGYRFMGGNYMKELR